MEGALKKGAGVLVLLFIGFWLVQDPNGLANSAQEAASTVWDVLSTLFNSLREFFQSITS
jgi:hypothetical protein